MIPRIDDTAKPGSGLGDMIEVTSPRWLCFGEPELRLLERLADLDGDNVAPLAARRFS